MMQHALKLSRYLLLWHVGHSGAVARVAFEDLLTAAWADGGVSLNAIAVLVLTIGSHSIGL